MSEDKSVLDMPEALNRALGDVEFLKMIMDEFRNSIPNFVTRIQSALQDGDMERLGKDAHQFKGAAASLGAKGIAAVSLELEQIGKNGDAADAAKALERLTVAVEAFHLQLDKTDWSAIGQAV